MTDDLYLTRLTEAKEPFAREHPTVWGSADDGPFDADALRDHDQRGFTILPEFLTGEEVETYRAELDRLTSDPSLRGDERVVTERVSGEVRSIFAVQQLQRTDRSPLSRSSPAGPYPSALGSEMYLHQTRINYMPGFKGSGFYWHSDFETWHAEDGTARAPCGIAARSR